MKDSAVIKRWYTDSKISNGGNKNLIDILIIDVNNKNFKVKINEPLNEKDDRIINGETVSTLYVSRFGFDFIIKVLIRQGYINLDE